ncbi:uncharacterized protein LOC115883300 isoform X2 [Sitophilus oryzae]|uniref:Uncharacterized protein LOC115883300 isoform X2 n=1 Tax=Sitophilus oryzae TaxID=7048 RepID=A0A6J2Y2K0_SITOR|nr:uncharacterized protein LOC115883300 isoform X2 [Sitophilus oryzae]
MDIIVLILLGISYVLANTDERFDYRYTCPKSFSNIGRKCYHFNNGSATWFQAFYTCHDLSSSNLTMFSSRPDLLQFERHMLKNKRKFGSQSTSFWVGGFKNWKQKRWIYTDGSPIKFLSLKDIDRDGEDNWTCLLFDVERNRWRAENCMKPNPFICETEPEALVAFKVMDKKSEKKLTVERCLENFETLTKRQKKRCQRLKNKLLNKPAAKAKPAYQSKPTTIKSSMSYICPQNWMVLGSQCYLFSRDKATWSDAHFNCAHINSRLAIIRSRVQDKKLKIFLNGFTEKQERWIGGRFNDKTKKWVWALNGNQLRYQGFAEEVLQNPTNGSNWNAIIMDPQYSYQWSYRNEMEKHNYICQVKGMAVKRLNPPRGATIEITSHPRYQMRSSSGRATRRANRNKRF